MSKCDIIIPVWNEPESTRDCLKSLKDNTRYPCRLILVDNASSSPTREYLDSAKNDFPGSILIRNNMNLGFVKAVNQGIVSSDAPYICILNNDAYAQSGWLANLVDTVERGPDNIGVANPTSNDFGKKGPDGGRYEWQELDSCKGFCMLIKREVINKIGLFDEVFDLGYFEEKDFSRRAVESGYICVRAKSSFVFHRDRLSFDKIKHREELFKRNENIYNKKWGRPLSMAFIEKGDGRGLDKDLIYDLLKRGHRVNIFYPQGRQRLDLKDHIQIRYFPVQRAVFGYSALFKLWERRKKKKIEAIVSSDERLLNFFNKYRFIHEADVIDGKDHSVKDYCIAKSREV